jgi:hypothetical protein
MLPLMSLLLVAEVDDMLVAEVDDFAEVDDIGVVALRGFDFRYSCYWCCSCFLLFLVVVVVVVIALRGSVFRYGDLRW